MGSLSNDELNAEVLNRRQFKKGQCTSLITSKYNLRSVSSRRSFLHEPNALAIKKNTVDDANNMDVSVIDGVKASLKHDHIHDEKEDMVKYVCSAKIEKNNILGGRSLRKRPISSVCDESKKFKPQDGICVEDISNGEELARICAVNTIDDEKPPTFIYTTKMVYPSWYSPTPPKGCGCVDGCSDSRKCSCTIKNDDEIPYNNKNAILKAKTLVYECGPCCKCPPSCYNKVSQNGIKIQLEIFKTESRGWGVRSPNSIRSGSFICEYIGELIDDEEAQERDNDAYLFDIGKNLNDCTHQTEDNGFTIDAAVYGNVGRFINHSCSPNLYPQNVIYDHDDKSIPHIMLFAAENIRPLQELTYDYNYSMEVCDSSGSVRTKSCYCGSKECTGKMY